MRAKIGIEADEKYLAKLSEHFTVANEVDEFDLEGVVLREDVADVMLFVKENDIPTDSWDIRPINQ